MKVSIARPIIELFPDIAVYGLLVKGINNKLIKPVDFSNIEDIDQAIFKSEIEKWFGIYNAFSHPKKARVSIKYLLDVFLKGKLKKINPIVDIYNYASLISMCPIGGEDVNKLGKGHLNLSVASGKETFIPFNSSVIENPLPKEVIWGIDDDVVVCRSMNFIESNDYKITEDTNNILFIIEKPLPTLNGAPMKAFSFIKEQLSNINTNVIEFTLTAQNTSVSL